MNRGLVFFLGMLFGIIFLFAAIGVGGYVFLVATPVQNVAPNSQSYLGDLSQLSLMQAAKQLYDTYMEENIANPDEEGHYFSIADYEAKFNANLSETFGFELSDETKDLPLFSLFTENGFDKITQQTSVAALTDLIKGFTNGDMFAADELSTELSTYNLSQLIENPTAPFSNVKMAWIIPSLAESDSVLVKALADCQIGGFVDNTDNLFLAIKNDERLASLGQLSLSAFLADAAEGEDNLIGNIIGDAVLADVISDSGNFDLNVLTNDLYIGSAMGYARTATETDGWQAVVFDEEANAVVMRNDEQYAKIDGEKWFVAKLACVDEENHTDATHSADCFKFVWTSDGAEAEGIYATLVGLKLTDLTDGDILGELMDSITLGEILGDGIDGTMLESFKDKTISQLIEEIDEMTVGELLGYDRVEVEDVSDYTTDVVGSGDEATVKTDGTSYVKKLGDKWYAAQKLSETSYSVWTKDDGGTTTVVDGMNNAVADLTIADLQSGNITGVLETLTLRDVLGDEAVASGILSSLADVAISDISTKINDLYVGQVMEYTLANEIENVATYAVTVVERDGVAIVKSNGVQYAKLLGEKWYIATYVGEATKSPADYTATDFSVWSSGSNPVSGVILMLTDEKIGDLGSLDFNEKINDLTIADVLGASATSSGVMKAIANVKIGELGTKINDIAIGEMLGYEATEADVSAYTTDVVGSGDGATVKTDGTGYAKKIGGNWYQATLVCAHGATDAHAAKCFSVWKDSSNAVISGLNSIIADKTLADLQSNGFDSIINDLTLREALGDDNVNGNNVLKLLADESITNLSTALNDMYLGSILGYTFDGTNWIDEDNNAASGAIKAVVGIKLGELNENTLQNSIQTLTLAEVLPNTSGNNVLSALADKQIGNLADEMDIIEMGVVLGLTKGTNGKWYTDEACTNEANTLNQKIASQTLGEFNTQTIINVVMEMKVPELLDSGLLGHNVTGQKIDDALYAKTLIPGTSFTYTRGDYVNYTLEQLMDALVG